VITDRDRVRDLEVDLAHARSHPLDLAWGTLSPNEQRMHAAAEARAFYRQPSREYDHDEAHRDQQRNAARDDDIAALVQAIAAVDEPVDAS
jgi:hypothetical protein